MPRSLDFSKLPNLINQVLFTNLASGRGILCEIVLYNGHICEGVAYVADIEGFNQELGEKAAYNKALPKVADIAAFIIRNRLVNGMTNDCVAAIFTQSAWADIQGIVGVLEEGNVKVQRFIDIEKA